MTYPPEMTPAEIAEYEQWREQESREEWDRELDELYSAEQLERMEREAEEGRQDR